MKNKLRIIFLIFILISCNQMQQDNKTDIISRNPDLFKIIDLFVKQNPFHIYYIEGKEYPSYNIIFDVKKNDTLMSIKLMHFSINEKFDKNLNKIIFEQPDGVFWYKKNIPIVFYNTKYYNKNFKNNLNKVPDSLLYKSGILYCGKIPKKQYLYKNKKFIGLE